MSGSGELAASLRRVAGGGASRSTTYLNPPPPPLHPSIPPLRARSVLEGLGVRPVVMAMLKHEDDEVRQQALLATSKMLVARWQFVSGQLHGELGGAAGKNKQPQDR